MVWLHGVLVSIVSDRDPRLQHTFGRVSRRPRGRRDDEHHFFYPMTNGQLEKTIQVLEDML